MRKAVEDLSAILPTVYELAVKVDDMIEGWGASGSASVDMNLVSDYLNSYTKYSEIMQEIRKVNPAEYMTLYPLNQN